jgi:hypothetical protein
MKVDDADAHQQSVEEIEPAVVEVHGEQAGRPSAGVVVVLHRDYQAMELYNPPSILIACTHNPRPKILIACTHNPRPKNQSW